LRQQYAAQQAQQGALAAAARPLQKDPFPLFYLELRNGQAKTILAGPLKNQILNIDHKLIRFRTTNTRSVHIRTAYV
jgi:hypothetical protein